MAFEMLFEKMYAFSKLLFTFPSCLNNNSISNSMQVVWSWGNHYKKI